MCSSGVLDGNTNGGASRGLGLVVDWWLRGLLHLWARDRNQDGDRIGDRKWLGTETRLGTESLTETGLHLEAVLPGLPVLLLVDQPIDQLEICKMEEVSKMEEVTSKGSRTYNQTCCAAAYRRCSLRNTGGRCGCG